MRLALCVLILIALLALALAWQPPAVRADLRIAYVGSVQTLDPSQMQASQDIRFGYALFEGLTRFNPYTFQVIPGVAERWNVSDDRLTYTFHLRPDARWSNGDPLTAADFADTWRQNLMPDCAGPYHEFLLHLRGGRAFADWCTQSLQAIHAQPDAADRRERAEQRLDEAVDRFVKTVGVNAADDRTLIVQLDRPVPYFLETVACWAMFPLHASVIDSAALDEGTWMLRRDPQWTRAGRMISNGPYRLAEWRFKRRIILERNEHDPNAGAVGSPRIAALNFTGHIAAFNAYESGAIDLIFGVAAPFRAELVEAARDGRRDDIHPTNNWGTYYFTINCRPTLPDGSPNPFADPRVRKALAMAVDKQDIVDHVTRAYQQVAQTFIPPNSIAGYTAPRGLDGSADEARRLLAEAGHPGGDGLPTVVLMYNSGGGHEKVAQAISRMWQERLGVDVTFRVMEWKVFLDARHKGAFTVARSGWFGDYGDPTTFLDLFATGNGHNDAGFSDPHYDDQLARAAAERDPERRLDILAEAERYILQEQVPLIPLYHYRLIHAYDPARIQGVSHHPRNLQMLHRIEKVDRPASVGGNPRDPAVDRAVPPGRMEH